MVAAALRKELRVKDTNKCRVSENFLILMLALIPCGLLGFAAVAGVRRQTSRTEEGTAAALGDRRNRGCRNHARLARFFEATGSLAGDQQTDVAPQYLEKLSRWELT